MTIHHSRAIAAMALAAGGLILLAACSSGSTSPSGHSSSLAVRSTVAVSSAGATSDSGTATSSAPVPDACTLISPQEASTALGQDAGTPRGVAAACSYQSAAGMLAITAAQPGGDPAATFDAAVQASKGTPGFQDVPGVADRAFLTLSPGVGQIEFLKGSTVVIIQLVRQQAATAASMLTLGKAAAGRM